MRRRHLLGWGATSALGAFGTQLWAAPAAPARLLVVFLRGGYDALNLLVPARSGYYNEMRPTIAVPVGSAAKPGQPAATLLNADWALHPALEASVLPLVRAGQVSFIPFAGTDDLSRSHFETQDSIELGQPVGGRRDFGSGFMNRLAATLGAGEAQAIAFTDQLPLTLRGKVDVANISLRNAPASPGTDRLAPAIAAMYRHTALLARVEEAFNVRDEVAREMARDMSGEMEGSGRGAINAKGFEGEARRIARVMRERYALGFVDIGGWDTHVGEGGASGYLASRFEELGRGLAGFADGLGADQWKRTVVVVISEFGRTVRENGGRGTDHGHGSVYWVLSGGLRAPPVTGEQVAVDAASLFQNRDLPVLNDYRAVLGGLMMRQFGLSARALDTVFPGVKPRDLGLV